MERAKALLREPEHSLLDVGLACGFFDQSHFSRIFASLEGTTPQRWRHQCA